MTFRHGFWTIVIVVLLVTLGRLPGVLASDIPLDSPLYPMLDRYWSEGRLDSYRPDQLPISSREAGDLLDALDHPGNLKIFLPGGKVSVIPRIGWEGGDEGFVPDNRSGIPVSGGLVAGGEFILNVHRFSLFADGRLPLTDSGNRFFEEAYGQFRWGKLQFTVGKENMWWGPGRRGSLLLTDNAEPRKIFRLDNYPDFTLPGFLKHLGGVRVSFFLSRLDDDRPGFVPDPIMGGLKIGFSPNPNLIFSLNRTFLFGGEGRDEDFGAFLDVLLGRPGSESVSASQNVIGNQIAGFSVIWRTLADVQPFTLYVDGAGEDAAGWTPSKWAFLGGIYLPRIGQSEMFDVRLEAASTDLGYSGWYTHEDYPYTYRGRLMGHPMGGGAEDLYIELGAYPVPASRLALTAARTRETATGGGHDILMTWGLKGDLWTPRRTITWQWVRKDREGPAAVPDEGDLFSVTVKFRL